MSQLMNKLIRIVLALMVLVTEINISMSVKVFEEMTQVLVKKNVYIYTKMKSKS